ncbi:MAG: NADH-quinone oxidoreductase subunit J [Thermomicrobiales bacterium]|nr:NADH-quinone oxidoreductase subunit J [Thermomicrobiales bacterium]MCC6945836.1 NADH-quinone oxidoreductase subunit J [Thermomicrobiales bacterium]
MPWEVIIFYLIAGVAILSAGGVVAARNPVHSAVLLMVCFIQIAAVFVMLGAEFLAVIQIIVYTGAILVLLLFVLMLVDPEDLPEFHTGRPVQRAIGALLGLILLLEVAAAVVTRTITGRQGSATLENIEAVGGNTEALGRQIYTEHLLAFEIVSMVLTIGILGAIVLAMPERLGVSGYRRRDTISLGHPRGTDLALPATAGAPIRATAGSKPEPAGIGRTLVMAGDPDEQPVVGGGRR